MMGTDREVQFGDVLEVDLTKETDDGHTYFKRLNCKFHPSLVEMLEDEGIIEVREYKDNTSSTIDFADNFAEKAEKDLIEGLIEANEELQRDVDKLTTKVNALEIRVDLLVQAKKQVAKSVKK